MENNNTMAEMLDQFEESFKVPRKGNVLKGKVVLVNEKEIVVNIGYKSDGIVPKNEISSDPDFNYLTEVNENDEIDVFVLKQDDGEGNVLLSMKRVSMFKDWDELEEIFSEEKTIEVRVQEVIKGGVIAYYNEVRGFIPASHLSVKYVKNLDQFVGKNLEVKIIELVKQKRKIVFSHKQIAKATLDKERAEFWTTIEEGKVIEGEVKRISSFGVFVNIGLLDGLVHITELSWGRIKSPKEVVKVGDKVDVKVLSFNSESDKISLSIKQVTPDPWTLFEDNYTIGNVYEGKVVNLTEFGAFVELEPGVEGLVHISHISKSRIEKPQDALSVGEVVNVKLIEAELEGRKAKLSIKEAEVEAPAEEEAE